MSKTEQKNEIQMCHILFLRVLPMLAVLWHVRIKISFKFQSNNLQSGFSSRICTLSRNKTTKVVVFHLAGELTSLRESEEKLKLQQQESTRRENVLVMRLATKEQEMQELLVRYLYGTLFSFYNMSAVAST